jgi:hypothetical protein
MPEIGDDVLVGGLEQKKFNGSGTVAGPFDSQKGRWPIKVGEQVVLVKESNLVFMPKCLGPLKSYMLQNGLGEVSYEVGKEIMRLFERIQELLEAFQHREDLPLSDRKHLVAEILQTMPHFVQFVKDNADQMSSLANVLFGYLNEVATWALPSPQLVEAIKHADGGIAECGAGSGLIAGILQDSGCRVVPFDKGKRYYDMIFTKIKRTCGSCFDFAKEGTRTLLMCWPERDPSNDPEMVAMVKNFHAAGGTTVLVSGTPPNDKGKCYGHQGTQALWDSLFGLFTETDRIQVPSFMRLPECLVVLKRKTGGPAQADP